MPHICQARRTKSDLDLGFRAADETSGPDLLAVPQFGVSSTFILQAKAYAMHRV